MPTKEVIQVQVSGLTMDPETNAPIVMLKEAAGCASFPLWIGLGEASAIATELEHIEFSRPLTHDLLKDMMEQLGGTLSRVELYDYRNDTFLAHLFIDVDCVSHVVESRPTDAIAMALRCNAPIFVSPKVMDHCREMNLDIEGLEVEEVTAGSWVEFLENLAPEEFGEYEM